MRKLVFGLVSLCGLVMVLGAGFLIVEKSISSDMRQSAHAAIEGQLDQMEDAEGNGRRARKLARAVEAARALGRGMFYKPGIDLTVVFPEPAEGWAVRAYADDDALRITGHPYKPSALAQNATQSALRRFEVARDGGKSAMVRVYEGNGALVAIRLELSKKDLRALDRASGDQIAALMTPAPTDRAGKPALSVDGIALREQPRVTQTPTGATHRADYTHLRFAVGRVAGGEIIAKAGRNDVLALMRGLNLAAILDGLPVAADTRPLAQIGNAANRLPQN